MQALLWPIVSWVFREVIIKFAIFTGLFAVVALLVPFAVGFLGNLISPATFTNAFNALPAGIWWFLDFFRLDYGLPLTISAFISRFLIRRLPVIG